MAWRDLLTTASVVQLAEPPAMLPSEPAVAAALQQEGSPGQKPTTVEPAGAGRPFAPVEAQSASNSLPILLQKWNPNKPSTVPPLGAAVRGEPRRA